MCGIFCSIYQSQQDSESSKQWNICKDVITARGPDYFMEKHLTLSHDWHGHFAASVLWMQGSRIMTQPSLDDNGNLLLWNGDLFSGCLAKDDVCDTNIILAELQSTTDIMSVLRKIEGPYCLVYYQKSSNMLYFGRDIIGRHSLLLKVDNKNSAILAAIAHEYVPEDESIDLINVAFERSGSKNQSMNHTNNEKGNVTQNYDVPDRKTGRQTYSELLRIYPNRKWNFIECNITQMELQLYRASRICDLLHPLCTILDESLGCAMWFASRAKGIGADELFGGYMRHRTILKHKGWDALVQELNVELTRISERNLGRDDRIVSDHGKQSRLPYLDENLVKYVQHIKPWDRCYPTEKMPSGLGDKLLLRLLACKIGFQCTANFPKRAFQFGSRIANSKENGNDVSNRL
ncbi:asparagine synthetase domain-containing protein 1 isoform X3 [Mycetomoellerius zeteki]|uniref:asparagine synthetase domain-containing protein 1 isoform X3 n=1 Tax=Mycetomoellerius zeteki TaxID=64791 RepID=UPI00084E9281|nr:PREDICTED: asparagine synthetase domain-containing protein 1 isoform X3 [Trachymyrmex zeteki]